VNGEEIRTLKTAVVACEKRSNPQFVWEIEESQKNIQAGRLKRISQGCISLAL
jgi:hypothetical protein